MNLNSIFAALGTLLYVTVLLGAATGVAPLRKLTPAHGASAGCLPSRDGFLRVRLRGDADTDIDWTDPDMQCDGGVRPDESGVRVTFAGHLPDGHIIRLVFGIAVPARNLTALGPRWFDAIVVPLVGVDALGRRLGMGGGFYDRALEFRRSRRHWRGPHFVGLAFDCQRTDSKFAHPWDLRLDSLATESGLTIYRGDP